MVQAVIPTTVVGLQGRSVVNTAPTANQALAWNGTAWAPAGPYLAASAGPFLPLTGGSISGGLTVSGTLGAPGTVNAGSLTATTLSVAGNFSAGGGSTIAGSETVGGILTINGNGVIYNKWTTNAIAVPWNGGAGVNYIVDANLLGTLTIVSSDQNLKQNFAALSVDCLSVLDKVTLQQFDWKPSPIAGATARPHSTCGFTAQQLETLIPEAVVNPGTIEGITDPPLSVDLMPLVAYCIGAIQQLSARVGVIDHQTA